MLTPAELYYCAQLAKRGADAATRGDCFKLAFGRDAKPGELDELHDRTDIGFEVQCRCAARAHVAALKESSLESLALDTTAAQLRAQQETFLALIGTMQQIQQNQANGVRLNPAEAKALDVGARVSGLIGESSITVTVPGELQQSPEELEKQRKALEAQLLGIGGNRWNEAKLSTN